MSWASDENRELRQKLAEYEDILKKALEGPYTEGVVKSECFNNLYRVEKGGGAMFIPYDLRNPELAKLKPGQKVLLAKSIIVGILPEELTQMPDPVHFDFVSWNEIGGLKSQIEKIRDTIELPLTQSNRFKKYGLKPSRGVILYGPPGCGKTMVAKAIASHFLMGQKLNKDSFIYLKGGEMLSPYVGAAEANIKSIFDRARANFTKTGQRSVIFIDEAEAILPRRGSRRSSDVDTTIVPTFLSEMDGFEENSTFIILATNFLEQIDEAVVRPGRIDLTIEISEPTVEDSVEILSIYLRKSLTNNKVEDLAKSAANHIFETKKNVSGATLKNIVERASLIAIKRELNGDKTLGITEEDLLNAIKEG